MFLTHIITLKFTGSIFQSALKGNQAGRYKGFPNGEFQAHATDRWIVETLYCVQEWTNIEGVQLHYIIYAG